ncbi:MAG: hypothetical protein CVU53_06845, partial [Deltaproteobacteria bacterium HGW-Deltaproteobacteria-11]
MWQRILGPDADIASLEAILGWLVEEDWLSWSRIGRNADEAEGYQVNWDTVEFAIPETLCRCMVCSRVSANDSEGNPCPRPGCDGSLGLWDGPIAEGNLNALLISADFTPPMRPAEHSAAVDDERRAEVEKGFQTDPPEYNILVCTPTLELGVNIGDLEGVAMRNIPPSPANYAQRAGRTGRTSRMGFSVGFARNTPHDGYFFDHPDEVIAGAIPPPRFNLSNAPAVARHVHSLVLQEAEIEYPSDMSTFISDVGAVNNVTLQSLLQRISVALERATQLAKDVFGSLLVEAVPGWEAWLEDRASEVPQLIADAVETRALLVEGAVQRMQELGNRVVQTQSQRDAEQGYRNLARKLRENYRYAYLPRVLAEMGVLPGYAFPGDPGSLSLGYDPEPLFTGRLQAQREYAPHQIVYARTHRWRVTGVAMNRPGSFSRTRGAEQFEFTECNTCGLAGPAAGANNCVRCGAELGGATTTAWDVGAFQAVLAEVEPETEEERPFGRFDVRVHPQRDVGGRAFTLGPWRFELRQQEEIWWINHGPLRAVAEGQQDLPAGFRLCQQCGELRPELEQPATGRGTRRGRDRRADRDEHDTRCGGEAVTVAIGHQDKADTLR